MLKNIMLLIALTTCSQNKLHYGEFDSYVTTFRTEAKKRGVAGFEYPKDIQFGSTTISQLAFCRTNGLEATIIVSRMYWGQMSEDCKEKLLMHELGHCSLRKPHSNGKEDVMYFEMEVEDCRYYKKNKKALLDELFRL